MYQIKYTTDKNLKQFLNDDQATPKCRFKSVYTELCTSQDQVKRINIAMFINFYRIQLTLPQILIQRFPT